VAALILFLFLFCAHNESQNHLCNSELYARKAADSLALQAMMNNKKKS
jgi:hypothetical protein